jgi:hypothetical protein
MSKKDQLPEARASSCASQKLKNILLKKRRKPSDMVDRENPIEEIHEER